MKNKEIGRGVRAILVGWLFGSVYFSIITIPGIVLGMYGMCTNCSPKITLPLILILSVSLVAIFYLVLQHAKTLRKLGYQGSRLLFFLIIGIASFFIVLSFFNR